MAFIRFVRYGAQIKLFYCDSDQGIVFLWIPSCAFFVCLLFIVDTEQQHQQQQYQQNRLKLTVFCLSSHQASNATEHIEILLLTLQFNIWYSIKKKNPLYVFNSIFLILFSKFISSVVHSIRILYSSDASCVFIQFVFFFCISVSCGSHRRVLYFYSATFGR